MRRSWALLASFILGPALLGSAAAAAPAPPGPHPKGDLDRRIDAVAQRAAAQGAGPSGVRLDNFRLVAHSPLDGFGDYGDLYAHGDFAYVGSRCGAQAQGGDGVQVVDISRPSRPRPVSTLANPPFTRAEDITVLDVETPSFTGALAVVGIQACFGSGHEAEVVPGLRAYDVTRPRQPRLIGQWDLPQGTIGCHEIDAVQRADGKVLAVCARNLVDHENSGGSTSIHIVDFTNPAAPRLTANWTQNLAPDSGVGCFGSQFTHSGRFTDGGTALYVSYWDAGTVRLDITDPAAPAVVSQTKITPPDEDGDNHSMTLDTATERLIINTEDTSPSDCAGQAQFGGWGEVYVYDNADPARPSFLGTFSTPNSRSSRDDGEYTDHNTEVLRGGQYFSSWYSDGIVWWTMDDHGASRQLGQFVPSATADGPPLVWGVFIDRVHKVILASDINSGLWIVKPKGLAGF
ncbi:MAG TPA: hypothetical protein VFU43_29595 [Streptosporangiaceae bacterium]|nr:hypothetical protein [Streptosporangiaceae bacterium]